MRQRLKKPRSGSPGPTYRAGASAARYATAARAAVDFSPEEFHVVERFLELGAKGMPAERRRRLAIGVVEALEAFTEQWDLEPLSSVDAPLSSAEADRTVLLAEATASLNRARLLEQCVSAEDAAKLVGRSRQNIERLRREGRLVALRSKNQWLYPTWQFEPDAPGGVVGGLAEVLAALRLSPAGAALWLTSPSVPLVGKHPLDLLRKGDAERVLRLAKDQGQMP